MATIVQAVKTALAIRVQDRTYWNWYLYHHI
jgi:hypothetical protein